MALTINSLKSHGMNCVSTKGQPLQSFNQRIEGFSAVILLKIGKRRRNRLFATVKMIKLGFFHLTINANSKLNNNTKIRR